MNLDRLRYDLADLAEEATPVDLRARTLKTSRRLGIQRAIVSSTAAIVLLGLAAGTAVAIMPRNGAGPAPAGTQTATAAPSPSVTQSAEPTIEPTTEPTQTPSEKTSATPDEKPKRLVLGPDGLGALKLGMSKAAAEATGLITDFEDQGCWRAELKGESATGGMVLYRAEMGVVVIMVPEGIQTVEGIEIGSSRAKLLAAYKDWQPVDGDPSAGNARGYAKVPGNNDALYRIDVIDDKVSSITLQFTNQGCYE